MGDCGGGGDGGGCDAGGGGGGGHGSSSADFYGSTNYTSRSNHRPWKYMNRRQKAWKVFEYIEYIFVIGFIIFCFYVVIWCYISTNCGIFG